MVLPMTHKRQILLVLSLDVDNSDTSMAHTDIKFGNTHISMLVSANYISQTNYWFNPIALIVAWS